MALRFTFTKIYKEPTKLLKLVYVQKHCQLEMKPQTGQNERLLFSQNSTGRKHAETSTQP